MNWFEKFYKQNKKQEENKPLEKGPLEQTHADYLEFQRILLEYEQMKATGVYGTTGSTGANGMPATKPRKPRKKTLYPKAIFDYSEPETPEFDENCTPECSPGDHKCGK